MKLNKPCIYFWITGIIISIIGLFYYNSIDSVAINIHDTYFVISTLHLYILFTFVFFTIGIIYWILSKSSLKLNRFLTKTHTAASILCFFIFVFGTFYYNNIRTESEFTLFDDGISKDTFITLIFIVFSFIQMLFITNLCASTLAHFIFNNKR